MNDPAETDILVQTAAAIVGAGNVDASGPTFMASEDFSFMLRERPGAYMNVGIARGKAGTALLHTPSYDFNDDAIPYGAALYVGIAERKLAA
jgi:hippurate hydrolase